MYTKRIIFLVSVLFLQVIQALASQDTLVLSCSKKDISHFVRNAASYDKVHCLILSGNASDVNTKPLFKTIAGLPDLKELVLKDNGLESWPTTLSNCKQIEKLTLVGSEDLFLEDAVEGLKAMRSLRELVVELMYPDELPYEIREMHALRKVTILSAELSDMRIGYEKALSDPSLYREESMIPRETAGILVVFIAEPRESFELPSAEEEHAEMDEIDLQEPDPSTSYEAYVIATPITRPPDVFERNYTSFDRPVEAMQTEKEYFSLPADKPVLVVSKCSGSHVMIPQDAFVDASGNPVEGDVVLDYREFRNPVDFILSGIPMSFNENGEQTFFKSAGMFEINASQNGKEIFLRDDASVNVNFVSTDSTEAYPFWTYVDSTGKWEEIGQADFSTTKNLPKANAFTLAHQIYTSIQRRSKTTYQVDTTSFNNRFEDLKYQNSNLMAQYRFHRSGMETRKYGLGKDYKIKIRKVRRVRGNKLVFELENNTGLNNELDRLGTKYWMYEGPMKSAEFRKRYSRRKEYTDMQVVPSEEGYMLRLKSSRKIIEIDAHGVKPIKKKHRTIYKECKVNYKAYQKAMKQKQKRFDRVIARNVRKKNILEKKSEEEMVTDEMAWEFAREYMTDEERAMSFATWNAYCDSMRANESAILSASRIDNFSLMRSLSIDGFGIYNCDQLRRIEKPVEIVAAYRDTLGKSIRSEMTYVLDIGRNAVLYYDTYHNDFTPYHIAFDQQSEIHILTIDKEGEVAFIKNDELKRHAFKNMKSYEFAMTPCTDKSIGEISALLGLQ